MCKTVSWIISNGKNIVALGGVLIGLVAWFYMMNGIPARVSKLESDVAELKTAMTQQSTKTDLMLQAVYEIRAVLLKAK